jgi:hypothetical protein
MFSCTLRLTIVSHLLVTTAQAVTVSNNSVVLSTNVAGTIDNSPPTSQVLPNSGSISVVGNLPTATNLGGGSWEFNGLSLATISAARGSSGPNSDVVASAQAAYQIIFTLGVGESANVLLDLGYSLSGSIGGAATNQSLLNQTIVQQGVFISSPGTYTFNLTGSVPSQTTTKNQSATVSVNLFDLQIAVVPEPGTPILGCLGIGTLLMRRRRIRA